MQLCQRKSGGAEEACLPDGSFALYMAGQFNKRTAEKAAATHGACHGYVQFNHMVGCFAVH